MSMTSTRPRRSVAVMTVAAAALATGCGTSTSPTAAPTTPDPAAVFAAAFTATTGAHTARVQIRTRTSADGGAGASVDSTSAVDGVIDFAKGTRQLVTQLPTGGQVETRFVDGALYTQLSSALSSRPGQKPWLKVTLPPQAAGAAAVNDPSRTLTYLKGAAAALTVVGQEQVRDATTTHYRADIDLKKLAAESGPTPQAGGTDRGALLRKLLGRDTLPLDVWVDAQQRVRRLQTVLPTLQLTGATGRPHGSTTGAPVLPSAAPRTTGSSTSTEEFYDFGVAVDVQPPPADQVQTPRRPPRSSPTASSGAGGTARPSAAPTAQPSGGIATS